MDEDLQGRSRDELLSEVVRLRAAIRAHRDASGHGLCWHHPQMWALLPERTDPLPVVPAWPQFMRGCIQYRQSLDDQLPGAPRMTEELRPADPMLLVMRFNRAINTRDLDALLAMITDDHRFVDSEGNVVAGRDAVREAWRGFFAAFPDYANTFTVIADRGDHVAVAGRSSCSVAALAGPALWTAIPGDGGLAEWRVHEDTPENRATLGL